MASLARGWAAALKRLESEALFVDQQAQIEIRKLEAEAKTKRTKVEAQKIAELQNSSQGLSEELAEWLKRHRLQKCAADIARIAGDSIVPSDLQYLTDENVEEIGSGLTHVEKMRLQAALRAVGEEDKAGTE